MLSPNLTLTIQSLKGLYAFIIPKHLTPKGRLRGSSRGPMGSSFPRHGARIRTKTQSIGTKQKKTPRVDSKLAQKKYRTKIYTMHEQIKWHDACPNAVQLSSNSQNWLEHRVSNTKTQKF